MYLELYERFPGCYHIYEMPKDLYLGNFAFKDSIWSFSSDRDHEHPITVERLKLILAELERLNNGHNKD